MRIIHLLLLCTAWLVSGFQYPTVHTVTGKIKDENGQPLASALIVLKGTKKTVLADKEGGYKIEVPHQNGVLLFSYIGFLTKEVPINGQSVINVTLLQSPQALQEVVVTAYSAQRKQSFTLGASQPLTGMAAGIDTRGFSNKKESQRIYNTEEYDVITENNFVKAEVDPLSTFSIDVDAAAYSNVRRYINEGKLPPVGAVRIEEMINYFRYDYPAPTGGAPFSVTTEMAPCPWNGAHRLVSIGLQGKKIPVDQLPPSNLVFLIDVSGSMNMPQKLPLVQASMKLLVDQLREGDKVSIVVYAGAAGAVLPPTDGSQKIKIKEAIEALAAGGSTAGGEGIKLAYKTARQHFVENGNNRVILCTDGDFNVGVSSNDELVRLVEKERESGVYLTVLGYGMGNYKDSKMQLLADRGNGNHAYIDGLSEAKKVLVEEFGGTLYSIANDVKLQVEFNPAKVAGYRLVGYENRMLQKEDFKDDAKDAGEMGSGHTVTALYEIIPAGVHSTFLKSVDSLKYSRQQKAAYTPAATAEWMHIKMRYKEPGKNKSLLMEYPVLDRPISLKETSSNFKWAAAVAQFGLLLRQSPFKQGASYGSVLALAKDALHNDKEGYRKEFVNLVQSAALLAQDEKAITRVED